VSFIEKFRDYEVGWMTVDSVRLKKSTLTPKGPIYTTIDTVQAAKV
ncbi:RNA 2',3'-cyclic phosphodiesterase, partial [Candidatus Bathyarchaeota archaeon]